MQRTDSKLKIFERKAKENSKKNNDWLSVSDD